VSQEPDISTFRPDRPGIRKVLGDLEADIMEIIWEHSTEKGITVRDVFESLYARRRIAYTSVMSTMARLAKKKLLRAEKRDQAYIYYSNFTEEEFVRKFIGHILESLLIGFSGETLQSLNALPDQATATHIQRLLEEIASRRAKEEGE
jgi:predicted transcriptional regulator